ncbi:NAD(P)/FAD-dependent oxidoreductase [Bartonella sp. DGB1]|uniref:NAD(P)/FAD-dependent oxidoreductase n=1 Tax=Bartonella sp. DGB1 TaxID=3239807 RepID=UPI0035260E74
MNLNNVWYEATLTRRKNYAALQEDSNCDVAIIGGGFTGVSAAYHLAKAGLNVILLEQCKIGSGASGRNGGQLGTGHRLWLEDLEKAYGFEKTKALFNLAEHAKKHLLNFITDNNLDVDYVNGHISAIHKPRFKSAYQDHIITMQHFGYDKLSFLDKEQLAKHLGSRRYSGGILDKGTGHLNPLKLLLSTAELASSAGAKIYENTYVSNINIVDGKILLKHKNIAVKAEHLLLATNGYTGNLESKSAARVMPIRSYVAATEILDDEFNILSYGESVDDSRFVVRYFKKTPQGNLLFGGKEAYTKNDPKDLAKKMSKQIAEVYPQLKKVKITHAWGGNVAITISRMPYVQQVRHNVYYIGGYSGHGVMLANFFGYLYSKKITKSYDKYFDLIQELKTFPFPGGRYLQNPLLFLAMTWYALLDRI